MVKALITSNQEIDLSKKSAYEAVRLLGISRPTLQKWILKGKVKVAKRKVADRIYYEIDAEEIKRIKASMVIKREIGKPLIGG